MDTSVSEQHQQDQSHRILSCPGTCRRAGLKRKILWSNPRCLQMSQEMLSAKAHFICKDLSGNVQNWRMAVIHTKQPPHELLINLAWGRGTLPHLWSSEKPHKLIPEDIKLKETSGLMILQRVRRSCPLEIGLGGLHLHQRQPVLEAVRNGSDQLHQYTQLVIHQMKINSENNTFCWNKFLLPKSVLLYEFLPKPFPMRSTTNEKRFPLVSLLFSNSSTAVASNIPSLPSIQLTPQILWAGEKAALLWIWSHKHWIPGKRAVAEVNGWGWVLLTFFCLMKVSVLYQLGAGSNRIVS